MDRPDETNPIIGSKSQLKRFNIMAEKEVSDLRKEVDRLNEVNKVLADRIATMLIHQEQPPLLIGMVAERQRDPNVTVYYCEDADPDTYLFWVKVSANDCVRKQWIMTAHISGLLLVEAQKEVMDRIKNVLEDSMEVIWRKLNG